MAPGRTRVYIIDDTSGTQHGGILMVDDYTWHETCPNHGALHDAEVEAERLAEIDRLEAMMHDRVCQEVGKHALQHREVKSARRAPMKHKKPHMNRKVIR
jgi:hypothetical protein